MSKPLLTVTLPILIDAPNEIAEGVTTCFPGPTRTRVVNVRTIKQQEIKRRLLEIFASKKDSPLNEIFLYVGADLLRDAYDAKDAYGLHKAHAMARPWIPTFGKAESNPDADMWEGVRWDYSSLMCNAVQGARIVAWWPNKGKRLRSPAVYCPNLKCAAFVTMMMGGIRVCPKCRAPFIPESEKQGYCKTKHGVAHRTARSRWNKKQRAEKARQQGKASPCVKSASGPPSIRPLVQTKPNHQQ